MSYFGKNSKYFVSESISNGKKIFDEDLQKYIPDPRPQGIYQEYRFPNGYHASVIKQWGSYGANQGLWEVVVFNADGNPTLITDNEIEHFNDPEVDNILGQIARMIN